MKTVGVQRAYVLGVTTERAIAHVNGEVYTPERGWHIPTAVVVTVPGGVVYERWSDVPHAWLGCTPWWHS